MFGIEGVSDNELPVYASEDFSEYLLYVPGCFFFPSV
jgi:metal-dependent amidase/aminoacylase/carboxypeptidase family protein